MTAEGDLIKCQHDLRVCRERLEESIARIERLQTVIATAFDELLSNNESSAYSILKNAQENNSD